ncbi:TPA: hypothetical protein PBR36_003639 [Escherichia coli]|nr:hypothetical protein [Escherichia coli]
MSNWNIAAKSQEERNKVNVDLAARGVAYKERLNIPVIAEQVAREQPAHLFHGTATALPAVKPPAAKRKRSGISERRYSQKITRHQTSAKHRAIAHFKHL